MTCERPTPGDVWRAVEAYLAIAYDGSPPGPVLDRLKLLRETSEGAFYDCDAFERADERRALRLGNRFYPHMKLVVEPSATGRAHFCVDTHDRHFLDLVAAADPALTELMERNTSIARAIERSWSSCGLRTSSDHRRDELARWRASRSR